MSIYMNNISEIIDISERPMSKPHERSYKIINTETGSIGCAELTFSNHYDTLQSTASHKKLQKIIGENSSFAILDEFLPHDEGAREPVPDFYRVGVGSYALNKIMKEIKQEGYNAIYVNSDPNAVGFYEKKGFKPLDSPTDLYKKL